MRIKTREIPEIVYHLEVGHSLIRSRVLNDAFAASKVTIKNFFTLRLNGANSSFNDVASMSMQRTDESEVQ